jgi:hypothetical protein
MTLLSSLFIQTKSSYQCARDQITTLLELYRANACPQRAKCALSSFALNSSRRLFSHRTAAAKKGLKCSRLHLVLVLTSNGVVSEKPSLALLLGCFFRCHQIDARLNKGVQNVIQTFERRKRNLRLFSLGIRQLV